MRNEPKQTGSASTAREPNRFSPYAIVREGPVSEDNDILPFFQMDVSEAVALPTCAERRRSPRFTAREHRLWIGWWVAKNQFHTVGSFLDNISQGGARVKLVDPPPTGQLVWLCLGSPTPTECVRAKVLEIIPLSSGDFAVRLAFGTPCPDNFYRIAVLGIGT